MKPSSTFLSTLPARGATDQEQGNVLNENDFYPRSPRGERQAPAETTTHDGRISIHAPREGSDLNGGISCPTIKKFLSTLPARGATRCGDPAQAAQEISIHAPREGSDERSQRAIESLLISIHAPREGSDSRNKMMSYSATISIHAPREGSDAEKANIEPAFSVFLSTLPARGATYFTSCLPEPQKGISIHAPREGSDRFAVAAWTMLPRFLSTLPARGATHEAYNIMTAQRDFYPRSPRGERRFLSLVMTKARPISIHAPREGSDLERKEQTQHQADFYPRSPRGERRQRPHQRRECRQNFYPRSPRGERLYDYGNNTAQFLFLSTLPARGATHPAGKV